jgi:hypothetical protein
VSVVTDRYKKLQLGVGCLCQATHEKLIFRNKKNLEPQSRPVGPRFGPCSPLSVTPRRKQLRPSPRSRPEVERATERRHLLAEVEVDRATTPLERCRLLGRGRGLPSCAASLATMAWREEEESRRLSMLTASPCPCASGGHGGELRDGEVVEGDVLEK